MRRDEAEVEALARRLSMGDSLFEELGQGERFRFAASPPEETLVKTGHARYRAEGSSRVFPTGSRTAVFRVPQTSGPAPRRAGPVNGPEGTALPKRAAEATLDGAEHGTWTNRMQAPSTH